MVDSLQLDSTQLAVFQQDPRFNYDRELVGGSQSFLEWLAQVIRDWLGETFNVLMSNDAVYYSLIVIGCLVLALIGWLLWKNNPKLFRHNADDEGLGYETLEDTIYGVDFDAEIREAVGRKDYRQAVRLVYLQTLKHLSDTGRIDWQPSKTPMQYMRQVDDSGFHELSRHFIRVRYGNFEATEQLFQRMRELQKLTIGTPQPSPLTPPPSPLTSHPSPLTPKKGGES